MQFCVALLLLLGSVDAADAAPTKLLSYQGRVTDSNGQPPADNTYQMRFRIYSTQADCDADSAANLLYTETHGAGSEKQVTNGLFSLVIGNITALSLAFDANYWLGVMVDSDHDASLADETQFTPCDRLTTSPYTIRAIGADSADLATNANACNADATCETQGLSATGSATLGDASGDSVTVNAGTFNFANAVTTSLPSSTSAWNIDSNTLVIDSTNNRVGIGGAGPSRTLSVSGSVGVTQNNVVALGDGTNLATVSSGGAYAHYGFNAYFNGSSWVENVDNKEDLMIQLDATSATKAIRFYYAPAAVGAPAWTQTGALDQSGNLTIAGDLTVTGGDITGTASNALACSADATCETSEVQLASANTKLQQGAGNALRVQTNSGYVDLGPQNTGWSHYITDRASHWFNTKVTVQGNVEPYTDASYNLGTTSLRWGALYTQGSGEQIYVNSDTSNPAMELRDMDADGLVPYIDFTNDTTTDYDARLQLTSDNILALFGADFHVNNNDIEEANFVGINDPGPGEGVVWSGTAAGWTIDVSPTNRTNADGNLNLYGTANSIVAWRDLYMGDTDGTGKKIYFMANDAVDEGGEFVLNGSGANADWSVDNYQGRVRMHTGGTSYFDLNTSRLSITGEIIASGDIYTTDPGGYAQTRLQQWGLLGGAGGMYLEPGSGQTLWLTDQWGATGKVHVVMDRLAVGPDSSTENVKLYKNGNITMSGLLSRSSCPSGFVKRGQNLCVEDAHTCSLSMSAAANRCRTGFPSFATHACTNWELRQAIMETTTIGGGYTNDYMMDQSDDNQCAYVNLSSQNDPEGEDGNCNDSDRCGRCCINLE